LFKFKKINMYVFTGLMIIINCMYGIAIWNVN
jgi:hypothetical protein